MAKHACLDKKKKAIQAAVVVAYFTLKEVDIKQLGNYDSRPWVNRK